MVKATVREIIVSAREGLLTPTTMLSCIRSDSVVIFADPMNTIASSMTTIFWCISPGITRDIVIMSGPKILAAAAAFLLSVTTVTGMPSAARALRQAARESSVKEKTIIRIDSFAEAKAPLYVIVMSSPV